jgi:acetyl-CoA C-acetyltransferase
MKDQKPVVICSAVRTPIGSFQGAFASLSASDLGALAVKEAIVRSGAKPEQIERAFIGNVLSAGMGQAPARQAVIKAGLPVSTGAVTINKVCGSGLQAVIFARREIACDEASVLIAGGMESMTNAPYCLPNARGGYRMGNGQIIDTDPRRPLGPVRRHAHGELRRHGCGEVRLQPRGPGRLRLRVL